MHDARPSQLQRGFINPRLQAMVDDELVAIFSGDKVPVVDDYGTTRWEYCWRRHRSPPATSSYDISNHRNPAHQSRPTRRRCMRDHHAVLGYQDHLVDGEKRARVITRTLPCPRRCPGRCSSSTAPNALSRKLRPRRLMPDAGTGRTVRAIRGVGHHASSLRWDAMHNLHVPSPLLCLRCRAECLPLPQGSSEMRHQDDRNRRCSIRANPSVCNACSVKSAQSSNRTPSWALFACLEQVAGSTCQDIHHLLEGHAEATCLDRAAVR